MVTAATLRTESATSWKYSVVPWSIDEDLLDLIDCSWRRLNGDEVNIE